MKLSDATRELIKELYQPVGLIQKLIGTGRSQVDILEDIRKTQQPLALLHICQVLSITPSTASRKASEVIHELLQHLPFERLVWLDQQVRDRSYSYSYTSAPWKTISPKLIGVMSIAGGTEVSVLGLASMQRSGYVRESAVDQLDKIDDGRELPFLLLRLNDWVKPVRDKAAKYVRKRIESDYALHFVNCLGLVQHLMNVGRTNQTELIGAVNALLQSAACKDALSRGLDSSDKMVKRISFQLASESTVHSSPHVCRKALSQEDTVVRLWAARTVVKRLDDSFSQLLPMMRTDLFMPVRRESLLGYMKLSDDEAFRQLKDGLVDAHSSIREFCRFYLKERGLTDFAAFYREALIDASGTRLIGVIAGLGEVGDASDVPAVKRVLDGRNGRLRKIAVIALAKLLKGEAIAELLPYLSDVNLSISRIVSRLLVSRIQQISSTDLWRIYKAEARVTAKKRILRLIGLLNRWIALPYLLQAHCQDDSADCRAGEEQLRLVFSEWNQSFTSPSKEQLKSISDILNQPYVRKDDPLVQETQSVVARYSA